MKEIIAQTKHQLLHYPELSGKDKIKRNIKYMLGRCGKVDRYFWSHGLLTQGLEEAYQVTNDKAILDTLLAYYDSWIEKGMTLTSVEHVINGYTLIAIYEKTGHEKYKRAADKIYEFVKNHSKDADGCLPYNQKHQNLMFIDTIGMIAPFLCRYGKVFGCKEATTVGINQILVYLEKGMDSNSGLPYHGYQSDTGMKQGMIGWGRAVGWLLWGMVDSLEYIDSTVEGYDRLRKGYEELAVNTIAYQMDDGYFAWQVQAVDGHIDTSATGMIGYAVGKGLEIGLFESQHDIMNEVVRKSKVAMIEATKNGKVMESSAECIDFAQYPQIYGNYPWAQGTGLRLAILKPVEVQKHVNTKKQTL
ncbi:MAG: glycoside hydrolase family 88 protein [Eubacteriales bacterium]